MGNWCVWLGGKRGRKNGGPCSFLSGLNKIESFQFKVKTRMKMSGNIVGEIAQANVQSFFVLFFSVSLVIRFLSSIVQLFDPFFDFFFFFFFFAYPFFGFLLFIFFHILTYFFLFLLSRAECFFSQIVNWVFFF